MAILMNYKSFISMKGKKKLRQYFINTFQMFSSHETRVMEFSFCSEIFPLLDIVIRQFDVHQALYWKNLLRCLCRNVYGSSFYTLRNVHVTTSVQNFEELYTFYHFKNMLTRIWVYFNSLMKASEAFLSSDSRNCLLVH